jgi:hypothetical protein
MLIQLNRAESAIDIQNAGEFFFGELGEGYHCLLLANDDSKDQVGVAANAMYEEILQALQNQYPGIYIDRNWLYDQINFHAFIKAPSFFVKCADCQEPLNVVDKTDEDGDTTAFVEPCSNCFDEAKSVAYQEGLDDQRENNYA